MFAMTKRPVVTPTATRPSQQKKKQQQQQQQLQVEDASSPAPRKPASFHDLPPEIHIAISQLLIYPDALSLKHTCRYLHMLVDTGVRLKIDWLIERRSLHLECPNDRRCDLGSDLKFCRGSVRLLMQRRREHLECDSRPGLGCLVYGTATCTHRKKLSERWKRWLRSSLTIEVWWLVAGMTVAVLAWCVVMATATI